MGYMMDKKEAQSELDVLASTVKNMPDDAKMCSACHALFYKNERTVCWCDYDSPGIDPDYK